MLVANHTGQLIQSHRYASYTCYQRLVAEETGRREERANRKENEYKERAADRRLRKETAHHAIISGTGLNHLERNKNEARRAYVH